MKGTFVYNIKKISKLAQIRVLSGCVYIRVYIAKVVVVMIKTMSN